jgi:two-component system nitrate/nitrite response regulator NarL
MGKGSGLELLREMRKEGLDTPFVLLADFLRDDEMMDALRLGIGGIVLEEMPPGLLVQCLRKVARNEQWFEKLALGRALERMLRQEEADRSARTTLTKRELEVVKLVSAGLRNKEIARRMSIGEGTVKLYLNTIYRKLDVSGRLELARHAHLHGLA